MKKNKYYLGLDIGTDSVGYAVTDTEYNLLKFKDEPAWGSHLFEAAEQCAARRAFRTARRRLDRRQQRVHLIQELFKDEIAKTDPDFFKRIQTSFLKRDDAGFNYSLFNDPCFKDKDYGHEYPTIHHLLKKLMESSKLCDVRLLYMACAWLVSHRGHFLSEIDASNIENFTDLETPFKNLLLYFDDLSIDHGLTYQDEIENILTAPTGVKEKSKKLSAILEPSKEFPYDIKMIITALAGGKIDSEKLFNNEAYKDVKFSLGDDDETLMANMQLLGEDATLIQLLKAIYDSALLSVILRGKTSISEAKVDVYNQHKQDLEKIKKLINNYIPEKYDEIFLKVIKKTANYTAYSGHLWKDYPNDIKEFKKANKVEFSKYLARIVKSIDENKKLSTEDKELVSNILNRLEQNTFLPKQRDTDNRVIPHQIYLYELERILENASSYLSFLNDKDEAGLSVRDKIVSVFKFRVPYYVGPLNPASSYAWIQKKVEGKIYPWNFDKIVDRDASEKEFMNRLLNTCTYLPGESVIPKDSLLYHRYMVLNEINNLKIGGNPISVELKQEIYNELFLKFRKVTRKKLKDYLVSNNHIGEWQSLTGIDEQINSDLRPWHDFKKLIETKTLSEKEVERIIELSTYIEDRQRFKQSVQKEFPKLSEQTLNEISRFRYKGFGRFSLKFLNVLEGKERKTEKTYTIMSALWETNCNLMELLSDKFTFTEEIEAMTREYYSDNKKNLDEQLDEMYVSNAVKRPLIRALTITNEVCTAFKGEPAKIFVEVPRGGAPDQKGKRTRSRKDQILDLYKKIKDEDLSHLKEELEKMGDSANQRLQSDTLFLYFMQLGRCMYTGDAISINKLSSQNYNKEHIYPQSFVKDDSIINNLVLTKSEVNAGKTDTYPVSPDIQRKMKSFWDKLKKNGLISDEKYTRLTRTTSFTEDEKWGFINRQLTETSQAAKALATILKERYPETEIVYVKAGLVSEFRQEFDLLKSRSYNDLHHAKDAYLNIVTGNVYQMKFTKQWFHLDEKYNVQVKKIFRNDMICSGVTVWDPGTMFDKVKKTMHRNHAHLTQYAFCRKGGLFDQQPLKAAPGLVSLKNPNEKNAKKRQFDKLVSDTAKYGGYDKATASFFVLVKCKIGGKMDIMVMPVELLYSEKFLKDSQFALQFARERISEITGKKVEEVSFPLKKRIIKINTVLSLDGFRVCICAKSDKGRRIIVAPLMPFYLTQKPEIKIKSFSSKKYKCATDWETYFKRLDRLNEKLIEFEKRQNKGKGKQDKAEESKKEKVPYPYDGEYDKVTKEENIQLYEFYLDKLQNQNSIYMNRPGSVDAVIKGMDRFKQLSVTDQCRVLHSIHQVFMCSGESCDLTLINGNPRSAVPLLSSRLSLWQDNYNYEDVRIIDCTASGLWEKSSQNLLDLL